MHEVQEIISLMPGKDCGSCGNPSCRTSARKIAVGDMKVEDCVNLKRPEYRQSADQIKQILAEGVEIGAKGTVLISEEGITYIHPCISEAGKLAAESRLTAGPEGEVDLKYGFLDPFMLCYVLDMYRDFFDDVKCSPRLGTAKMEYDGKIILVFQNGKIKIRQARDREDVLNTLRLTARVMWGSIICSCCGNAGIDCASGGCEECVTRVCPVLAGGPPEPPTGEEPTLEKTTGATTFVRVDKLETADIFMQGISNLDQFVGVVGDLHALNASLLAGKKPSEEIEPLCQKKEELLKKVNLRAIDFVVKTPRKQDAILGLILSGLAADFKKIFEAELSLSQAIPGLLSEASTEDTNKLSKFHAEAWEISALAYKAFKESSFEQADTVVEKHEKLIASIQEFEQKLKERPDLPTLRMVCNEIRKIANNGFYVARLIPKPLPA
jgi:ArsR family metal-binding transcriptional regulator